MAKASTPATATQTSDAKGVSSALSSLKLVAFAKTSSTTTAPVVMRRNAMCARLNEQLELLKDPSFKNVLRHRQKNEETGKTEYTNSEHKIQPWYQEQPDGSFIFQLRAGYKAIEISPGLSGIVVPRLDQLPETIQIIQNAVRQGELDKVLAKASEEIAKKLKKGKK